MTNKLKFCIVVNINTSGNKKLLNGVISLLRNNHDVEVFESKSENIAREIFRNLSSKIFDRLVLAGGDGSVNFAKKTLKNTKMKHMFPLRTEKRNQKRRKTEKYMVQKANTDRLKKNQQSHTCNNCSIHMNQYIQMKKHIRKNHKTCYC